MENRYPLFAGGRILKKESLWDLRDYAYGGWQLQYADYTDGVIKGCRVRVEGNNLIVGKGMMKYGNFIFLMDEEAKIPFKAENRTTVLKAGFEIKREHSDYLAYEVGFFLDHELERKENQIELCRFHLREGSVLRDRYESFSDMGTEYDTVNLIYATVAGKKKGRLHPDILWKYAKELLLYEKKDIEDRAFCYQVFQQQGEIETDLLDMYLFEKKVEISDKEVGTEDNMLYFKKLVNVLSWHDRNHDDGKNRKFIIIE